MLRTIVVPLDGSELSRTALPVASDLARLFDAGLTLLTSGWGSTVDELQGELVKVAGGLDVPAWETVVVPDTFPGTAIATAVEDDDAAIVMATHGRSGLGKALLGSVAEDLLKLTDRPVVLLGPSAAPEGTVGGGVMVVSTDGSTTSLSIAPYATRWAQALGMSVRVVGITRPDGEPLGGADAADLGRGLDTMAGAFGEAGVEVRVERVTAKDAAPALVDLARNLPAAMVAMATHGRTGLERTALGSTAMRVVHDAPCPVLVHRPDR